jgi:hypothetical protein
MLLTPGRWEVEGWSAWCGDDCGGWWGVGGPSLWSPAELIEGSE